MEWGGDRGAGSRPARALRRSHWLAYRHARPQAAPEPGFGASHRARAPRARHQCREIRGAVDGCGSCRRQLGDRRRYPYHELDRARGPVRICAETARVRHHSHGSDGGAQRGRQGRPGLCALRPDLAPDLPGRERAGARGRRNVDRREAGADVTARDKRSGATALDWAWWTNQDAVVAYLKSVLKKVVTDGMSARPPNSVTLLRAHDTVESGIGLVSRVTPVHTAMRSCARDEGRPFEFGNEVLISSHRKLLSSKAMVVNVSETA